jgi:plasmid stability protein
MAQLIVRNLDPELVQRLKLRAARHGRSMEAEHREILRQALQELEQVLGHDSALTPRGQRMTMEHHTDWSSSPGHVPVNKQQQYLEQHRLW